MQVSTLYTIRDEKIVRGREYFTMDEALRAPGADDCVSSFAQVWRRLCLVLASLGKQAWTVKDRSLRYSLKAHSND
jgi:hypothetical protein